jgi:opacity protein-like surface antigen
MRTAPFVIAAILTVALSGTAAAQSNVSSVPAAAQTPASAVVAGATRSHWLLTGFAGSNFAAETENADIDSKASFSFGGDLGYLWNGILGVEAMADFSPAMEVPSLLFASNPNVYSYMANVIGALPLGAEGNVQPYISGGLGTITMKADVITPLVEVQPVDGVENTIATTTSTSSTKSRFGGNIGAGLMGFAGHIGFRTDVRYFHAMTEDTPLTDETTVADALTREVLSGLRYWRANLGIALRW